MICDAEFVNAELRVKCGNEMSWERGFRTIGERLGSPDVGVRCAVDGLLLLDHAPECRARKRGTLCWAITFLPLSFLIFCFFKKTPAICMTGLHFSYSLCCLSHISQIRQGFVCTPFYTFTAQSSQYLCRCMCSICISCLMKLRVYITEHMFGFKMTSWFELIS